MKKNLFKAGDIIRHKASGKTDIVDAVPGDYDYDKVGFRFNALSGMLTKDDGWEFQNDWELVVSKPMAISGSGGMGGAGGVGDPRLQTIQNAINALKQQVATPNQMGNYSSLGTSLAGMYPTSSGPSGMFSQGSKVVLSSGNEGDVPGSEHNPFWGKNNEYIYGVVEQVEHSYSSLGIKIIVSWTNGRRNRYDISDTNFMRLEDAPAPQKKVFSTGIALDTTKLDALVLEPKVKSDILALLYQHKHSKKLFEEWGLGDVIEYGRGMTMMFYGPPGTGKTYGANCIAKALGKELLVLGAAEIQTSEPGGANRNIQQAFATASTESKVLFIDECDSLISNRNNLGMILASEINTLLTEIEKFEGVCILASNRIGDMDPALERRLSLIIEFPMPNLEQRMEIWKKLLPPKMPLHESVKVEELAKMELSGGLIKNVVLQGARLALSDNAEKVEMAHFERALDRVRASKGLMGKERIQTDGMSVGPGTSIGVEKSLTDFFKDRK